MKQLNTKGIILSRTDYGEADRILTLLTPDYGKLRLLARGVRRVKSKLAGGIELFSVSNITFIKGRGEIGTLVSTRLIDHYGGIVSNLERVQLGYDLIKRLNRVTEDQPDREYFDLLEQAFKALDDPVLRPEVIKFWFGSQLLRSSGHTPNLRTDTQGNALDQAAKYDFGFEAMAFAPNSRGRFTADHIKFLRLALSGNQPMVLQKIKGAERLLADCTPLIQTMLNTYLRL